jgi:hypothetical protein
MVGVTFIASVVLACALATSAYAFPGSSSSCDTSGCHGSAGTAPGATLTTNDGTSATYSLTSTGGKEWAVFSGSTRVAGTASNGATGTFTVPVGSTYTVYSVYGAPSTGNSCGKTTVTPSGSASSFTITASAGAGGWIWPSGAQTVSAGGDAAFIVSPFIGYLSQVLVDGQPVTLADDTYTFADVTADHTIDASFAWVPLVTNTSLKASAKTIKRGRYVKLTATLSARSATLSGQQLRFECRTNGSSKYRTLKTVAVDDHGVAVYRYKVTKRGVRYHRVSFLGDGQFLASPTHAGIRLTVK